MISVDVPHLTRAIEYFDQFLSCKIGQLLLPDVRSLTTSFGVALREDPQLRWKLLVEHGVLKMVEQNDMPTNCSFSLDADALLAIVCGRLAPQQAFFQRRVDIGGDLAAALKTAAVMTQFFRRFPYTIR